MTGTSAVISLGQGFALPSVRSQLAEVFLQWNWQNASDATYQTFYTGVVAVAGVIVYFVARRYILKYSCDLA